MKLYELTEQYNNLMEAIENGEIPEEAISDTLESITGELEDKLESIACVIKNLKAEAEMLRNEEKALAERRQAKERSIESIKDYLENQMIKAHITKLDKPKASISFRTSKAVEISDEAEFLEWAEENNRDDLLSYKVSIAKAAIKQSLETGAEIPFATIVERKSASIK